MREDTCEKFANSCDRNIQGLQEFATLNVYAFKKEIRK